MSKGTKIIRRITLISFGTNYDYIDEISMCMFYDWLPR
jgi:hypothetical protein